MRLKISIYLTVIIILALTIACVFCPVVASAFDVPADYFPDFQSPLGLIGTNPYTNFLTETNKTRITEIVQKAYDIGLFGGAFPFLITQSKTATSGIYRYQIYALSATQANDVNGTYKPSMHDLIYDASTLRVQPVLEWDPDNVYITTFVLCTNGTYWPLTTSYNYVNVADFEVLAYFDPELDTTLDNPYTGEWKTTSPGDFGAVADTSNGEERWNVAQFPVIIGAYDAILAGSTVGGDGYDDGYNDGYDVGYGEGHNVGYTVGYDNGYETGYDDGLESGYDIGFDQGVDLGQSIGYDEGYETGYDDGYDDGYERGEFDASPITIDIPDVITSVPQSAKAIINNAFGFELFGINIAGLLSVLLIVAIIAFVVKWLTSR